MREREARRLRLDDPDPGGLLLTEQDCRHDERPDDDQRREQDRQDEPATAPALEDLATGDQPDAPPATHATSSTTGEGAGVTASMNSSDSFGGS